MLCLKVEILLPENVVERFYFRIHDDHNLNKLKDKLFQRYEILNNASFKMFWIDNAGDRINILEEDDLRTFFEMKGSKVIVFAEPSDKATIINEFVGLSQDVNGNNINTRCDQSVKNSELKCSECNLELRGIRFERSDRFNFYLCFLCGMSKKEYNLRKTIHTVQPLNESHTMITCSSQTKEISEWMENSKKRVTDLMNEGRALEETLISMLRRGTTAVKTVATRKELLQDNLRGSKSIKEDEKVVKTLPTISHYFKITNLVSPAKLIAPEDEAKEGSVKSPIATPENSSDCSLDWQGPNNFPSKCSKECVNDSSDESSSDDEEANKVHEHPKDSSDDSSSDEDDVKEVIQLKSSLATPANSSDGSSSDQDQGPNNFPTLNESSDDSSSDEEEGTVALAIRRIPAAPKSSSDDSSSDEDNQVHVQASPSPTTSAHTDDDKSSDKEETIEAIPLSSAQPTLENMNLPTDLLQWIQWINRTQQR